jgi:spectinomycin phosphotransferase/16S rRNA (guanine(1405)-N(7))-methyltransferase
VLAPPADLAETDLRAALARDWSIVVRDLTYLPLGFGSHHWDGVDATGDRWFVTVDDLPALRASDGETTADARARLAAALDTASLLADAGHDFVVAPHRTLHGEVLADVGTFAVSLFPFVTGERFSWGGEWAPGLRPGLVDLLARLHETDPALGTGARVDDFRIPHRQDLERALDDGERVPDTGPYSEPLHRLLRAHRSGLRARLDEYDGLVTRGRDGTDFVLTHGEPHPGNVMRVDGRYVLVDWESVRLAPRERDLWCVDAGDGAAVAAYTAATGAAPDPVRLQQYALRWDLADLAAYTSVFRAPHAGDANDAKAWGGVERMVPRLAA